MCTFNKGNVKEHNAVKDVIIIEIWKIAVHEEDVIVIMACCKTL